METITSPENPVVVTDPNNAFPPSFDFLQERKPIDALLTDWEHENNKVKERRKIRENRRNVQEEQQIGTILKDETIIPDRTINTNIHRGRVSFLNYITQSKRLLIIEDTDDPNVYTEPLELWFTRGMRYPKWKVPWFKLIDSIHTHGGAALEVVYDPSAPFNCVIEYIPRDSLIFNRKTRDIQSSPRLLRKYEISILQFDEFTKTFNFAENAVKEITDKYRDKDEMLCIYKLFMKRDGVVFNAWFSSQNTTDWLRAPMQHDIGLKDYNKAEVEMMMADGSWDFLRVLYDKPMPLKAYPIIWYPYDVTEDEELLACQGRVALDIHVQEALTHLLTNTVNASTRASNFYPSAETQPGEDPKLEELGPLKPGVVMSRKITTFQPEWPNNILLAVTQVLDQRNANQTGNTDFAAIARKDANKTATEMQLAVQQHQSLNITELDIFSSPFLDTYAMCFEIARSQAIFMLCKPPSDFALLFGNYDFSPAGDIEVIKRLEERERAKEFFNIVKGTPLAEKLFAFLIQQYFPDQASDWIKVMNTPDKNAIIAQLVNILNQIPTDELTPEQRTALRAVIISAQNVVGPVDNQEISGNPAPPQAIAAPIGNAPQ